MELNFKKIIENLQNIILEKVNSFRNKKKTTDEAEKTEEIVEEVVGEAAEEEPVPLGNEEKQTLEANIEDLASAKEEANKTEQISEDSNKDSKEDEENESEVAKKSAVTAKGINGLIAQAKADPSFRKTLLVRGALIGIVFFLAVSILQEQFLGEKNKVEQAPANDQLAQMEAKLQEKRLKKQKEQKEQQEQNLKKEEEKQQNDQEDDQTPVIPEPVAMQTPEEVTVPTTEEEKSKIIEPAEIIDEKLKKDDEDETVNLGEGTSNETVIPEVPTVEEVVPPTPSSLPSNSRKAEKVETLVGKIKDNTQISDADKDNPVLRSKEAPPLPSYTSLGRGLIYNCKGQHWACVDRAEFYQCRDNELWSKDRSIVSQCVVAEVYLTTEDCHKAQQQKINTFSKPTTCNP